MSTQIGASLPTEIYLKILEISHDSGHLSSAWRTVSRQFNDMVAPLHFSHVTLTQEHVDCFADVRRVSDGSLVRNHPPYIQRSFVGKPDGTLIFVSAEKEAAENDRRYIDQWLWALDRLERPQDKPLLPTSKEKIRPLVRIFRDSGLISSCKQTKNSLSSGKKSLAGNTDFRP